MVSRELPKYYANVCKQMPKEYSNYTNYELQFGDNINDYEIGGKIGRGKYSDVFKGYDSTKDIKTIIKILKPVRSDKYRREIKILMELKGGPHIVELLDMLKDPACGRPSLIFGYTYSTDFKSVIPNLTEDDLRYYLYCIFRGLDYCHSKGIMHRDIKPQNIIVNPETHELKIIDWGLAEYYLPGQDYNVRVSSRYYKGPELLVNNRYYDYSLDVWSTGVMFSEIIFKLKHIFKGFDNYNQLEQINKVMGTEDLKQLLVKYDLQLDVKYNEYLGRYNKKKWDTYITSENMHFCTPDAMDLL